MNPSGARSFPYASGKPLGSPWTTDQLIQFQDEAYVFHNGATVSVAPLKFKPDAAALEDTATLFSRGRIEADVMGLSALHAVLAKQPNDQLKVWIALTATQGESSDAMRLAEATPVDNPRQPERWRAGNTRVYQQITTRRNFGMCALSESEILIAGGMSESVFQDGEGFKPLQDVWILNLAKDPANQVTQATSLPKPLASFSLVEQRDKIYIFGGRTEGPEGTYVYNETVYEFRRGEHKFVPVSIKPELAREGMAAIPWNDRYTLVYGGFAGNRVSSDLRLVDLCGQTSLELSLGLSSTGSISSPRATVARHSASILRFGETFVLTGGIKKPSYRQVDAKGNSTMSVEVIICKEFYTKLNDYVTEQRAKWLTEENFSDLERKYMDAQARAAVGEQDAQKAKQEAEAAKKEATKAKSDLKKAQNETKTCEGKRKAESDNHSAALEQKQTQIDQFKAQIEELQTRIEELTNEAAAQEAQHAKALQDKENTAADLRTCIEGLEAEKKKLEEDRDGKVQDLADVQGKLATCQQNCEGLGEELRNTQDSRDATAERLQQCIDKSAENSEKFEAERLALKAQVDALQAKVTGLTTDLDKSREDVSQQATQLGALRAEEQKQRLRGDSLENELSGCKALIEDLKGRFDESTTGAAKLKASLDDITREHEALAEENRTLTKDLSEARTAQAAEKTAKEKLAEDVRRLEGELKDSQAREASSEAGKGKAEERVADLSRKLHDAEQKGTDFETENLSLKGELERVRRQNEGLKRAQEDADRAAQERQQEHEQEAAQSLQKLEEEKRNCERALKASQRREKDLQHNKEDLEKSLAESVEAHKAAQTSAKDLQARLDALRREHDSLMAERERLQSQLTGLQDELSAERDGRKSDTAAAAKERAAASRELDTRTQAAREEMAKAQGTIDSLKKKLSAAEERVKSMAADISRLTADGKTAATNQDGLRGDLEAERATTADLRSRLEASEGEAQSLRERLASLEDRIKKLTAELLAAQKEGDAQTQAAEGLRRDLKRCEGRLGECSQARQKQDGDLASQAVSIQKLEGQVSALTAERDRLLGELDTSSRGLTTAQTGLEASRRKISELEERCTGYEEDLEKEQRQRKEEVADLSGKLRDEKAGREQAEAQLATTSDELKKERKAHARTSKHLTDERATSQDLQTRLQDTESRRAQLEGSLAATKKVAEEERARLTKELAGIRSSHGQEADSQASRIHELQRGLDETTAKVRSLEGELARARENYAALQSQAEKDAAKAKEDLTSQTRELDSQRQERARAEADITRLNCEIASLQVKLEALGAELQAAKKDGGARQSELDKRILTIATLESKLDDLQRTAREQEKERRKARQEAAAQAKRKEEANAKSTQELHGQIDALSASVAKLESERASLQAELVAARTELQGLQDVRDKQDERLKEASERITVSANESVAHSQTIADQERAIAELTQKAGHLQEQLAEARGRATELGAIKDRLEADLEAARVQGEALREDLATATTRAAQAEKAHAEAQARLESLGAAAQRSEISISQLQEQLEQLQRDIAGKDALISKQTATSDRLRKKIAALNEDVSKEREKALDAEGKRRSAELAAQSAAKGEKYAEEVRTRTEETLAQLREALAAREAEAFAAKTDLERMSLRVKQAEDGSQKDFERLRSDVHRLTEENGALQSRIAEASAELSQHAQAEQALTRRVEELVGKNSTEVARNTELTAELKVQRTMARANGDRVAELLERSERYERTVRTAVGMYQKTQERKDELMRGSALSRSKGNAIDRMDEALRRVDESIHRDLERDAMAARWALGQPAAAPVTASAAAAATVAAATTAATTDSGLLRTQDLAETVVQSEPSARSSARSGAADALTTTSASEEPGRHSEVAKTPDGSRLTESAAAPAEHVRHTEQSGSGHHTKRRKHSEGDPPSGEVKRKKRVRKSSVRISGTEAEKPGESRDSRESTESRELGKSGKSEGPKELEKPAGNAFPEVESTPGGVPEVSVIPEHLEPPEPPKAPQTPQPREAPEALEASGASGASGVPGTSENPATPETPQVPTTLTAPIAPTTPVAPATQATPVRRPGPTGEPIRPTAQRPSLLRISTSAKQAYWRESARQEVEAVKEDERRATEALEAMFGYNAGLGFN